MFKKLHLFKLKDIHQFFVLKFIHSCIYEFHLDIFEHYFKIFAFVFILNQKFQTQLFTFILTFLQLF